VFVQLVIKLAFVCGGAHAFVIYVWTFVLVFVVAVFAVKVGNSAMYAVAV